MEMCDIYGENGEATGHTALRGSSLARGQHFLIVQIWIRNEHGAYLIQQRAPHLVSLSPGPTCGLPQQVMSWLVRPALSGRCAQCTRSWASIYQQQTWTNIIRRDDHIVLIQQPGDNRLYWFIPGGVVEVFDLMA